MKVVYTKSGEIEFIDYKKISKLQNDDVFIFQRWNHNNQLIEQKWYLNNKLHNKNSPAWQRWDDQGRLIKCKYYLNGQLQSTSADFQI